MNPKMIKKFNKVAGLYGLKKRIELPVEYKIQKRSNVNPKTDLVVNLYKFYPKTKTTFGPVLIPETFDLQEDIISPAEIEKAIHNFMLKLNYKGDPEFLEKLGLNNKAEAGLQHEDFSRKIAFVEMYIAPVDMTVNKRKIKKGTALAVTKVFDPELVTLIEAGRITGFSIGGQSKVIPLS